jgi:hypothetical protein
VPPPRSILSPTLLLQKPLMSVLIRIIEVEIARLTDQPGLGKRVKQQAQIMRILLMRRKDVREILPYHRLSLVTTRWTGAPSYSLPSCPSSWIHAPKKCRCQTVESTDERLGERHHRMQPCRRSSHAKPERSWASGPAPSNGSRHLDWSKQNWAQQRPQPGENAVKMAAAEVAVGLHVSDHGLDCRATPQFAPDGAPALRKLPSPALDPERAWETTERS